MDIKQPVNNELPKKLKVATRANKRLLIFTIAFFIVICVSMLNVSSARSETDLFTLPGTELGSKLYGISELGQLHFYYVNGTLGNYYDTYWPASAHIAFGPDQWGEVHLYVNNMGVIEVYTKDINYVTQFSTDFAPDSDIVFEIFLSVADTLEGDLNGDGCVDRTDLSIILDDIRGSDPHDLAYDLNGDGSVNIADARYLVTLFTNPRGAACE